MSRNVKWLRMMAFGDAASEGFQAAADEIESLQSKLHLAEAISAERLLGLQDLHRKIEALESRLDVAIAERDEWKDTADGLAANVKERESRLGEIAKHASATVKSDCGCEYCDALRWIAQHATVVERQEIKS